MGSVSRRPVRVCTSCAPRLDTIAARQGCEAAGHNRGRSPTVDRPFVGPPSSAKLAIGTSFAVTGDASRLMPRLAMCDGSVLRQSGTGPSSGEKSVRRLPRSSLRMRPARRQNVVTDLTQDPVSPERGRRCE